jgi:hypothetical protein
VIKADEEEYPSTSESSNIYGGGRICTRWRGRSNKRIPDGWPSGLRHRS